ncbi:MAG: hypothetical protein KIS66_07835 [Fimbriimonadaceae bacterium]|nr:hypothetical protein [Fimbriimonadaceae bacterium]
MYKVIRNGRPALEAAACGIGFLATRKGVAERRLVEYALELCTRFDHRGAPGHGAGIQVDIPWPLLLDRFPDHAKLIAQRDCALGMFFLPFDAVLRRRCVTLIEELAALAGADVLEWADVPVDPSALPPDSSALRTLPVVRQALFKRGAGMSEDEWFACRYLLRLAVDERIKEVAGDNFAVVSLSNRTVVYKGLVELSRIGKFYPDLRDEHFASRYVLFHSRYCTNTTTAWRRAQPFWSLAHNGEINTIDGNVAWMQAIGNDLIRKLVERHPRLEKIARRVDGIVCPNGSDSANLDDMLIALLAGGMDLSAAILALLPEATSMIEEKDPLRGFYQAMLVYLGACDGPAAIVACDGTTAVAHLDRNGLRPLWVEVTDDYVFAASELTGTRDIGQPEHQRILGPGGTVVVNLNSGDVEFDAEAHRRIARRKYPRPQGRIREGQPNGGPPEFDPQTLKRLQIAFGMGVEDLDVVLEPMLADGKVAIGSMGDDTPPAAMLDALPRRPEGYFKLRFAQETSPPIDPIRDAWVFSSAVIMGDRSGLWAESDGPLYRFEDRLLSGGELNWLRTQPGATTVHLRFDPSTGSEGLEAALSSMEASAAALVPGTSVLVLSDRNVAVDKAPLPALRFVSRLHRRLVKAGLRHRVALVADAGVWDVQHCALLLTMGADAVCPWLGSAIAGPREESYLKALRGGFREAMSMMGITPSSAYCGAALAEAVGLDRDLLDGEFGGLPGHLEGIGRDTLNREWIAFHRRAFAEDPELVDAGEFRHAKGGRPHANDAGVVRSLHAASGYAKKIHEGGKPGSYEAYRSYSQLVSERAPVNILDCLRVRRGTAIPLDDVEPLEAILWRFMAPGMSEGAISEPAHRAVARGLNAVYRYCRLRYRATGRDLPPGIGPIANTGEGGFDKARVGTNEANRSVQYAGGRFTITPFTAATAAEAEVKFAQGAKPGKGGQLPGKKVDEGVALRRGCNPGYELVSPPINHNLYSIEDVKLMLESWRHLNPDVNCALKYVATTGIELVCLGGVNAGANRLHVSDGCGGTGAAKRVDQKSAGVPVATVLPAIQDLLVEEGARHLVELSVDGGVQTGEQALKLMLLGADRVGFGTSLLMAIGCSMLRKCHLAGPDPRDPTGVRRLGCAPGVATQDPALVAKFSGKGRHVARILYFVAREIRERMAEAGIASLSTVVGRRDLLEVRADLVGKAALLDLSPLVSAPSARVAKRDFAAQTTRHLPRRRSGELDAALAALGGASVELAGPLTNQDRCVGVEAAGVIARACGDPGLPSGKLRFHHTGAAGHFYAAYSVHGMEYRLEGLAADSCWTASYGGKLVVVPRGEDETLTVVGNAFGYGARGGEVFLAGRGGNRFGICFRKNLEGAGPIVVVEGVEANAFQYMTGGTALVLGSTGVNLGSGMTGGVVYLLDADPNRLNRAYVQALELAAEDEEVVRSLLERHVVHTQSARASELLAAFAPARFRKVVTRVKPEAWR